MKKKDVPAYDFKGCASSYGVECTDGRTIMHGAFKHQDGERVPFVWRHGHDDITNVIGHGILRSDTSCMKVELFLNNSDPAKHAREIISHGDVSGLSVWANEVQYQRRANVSKAQIREVSLVLAGKNPGAKIDDVFLHGDDFDDPIVVPNTIIIYSESDLLHQDNFDYYKEGTTRADVLATLTDEQLALVTSMVHSAFMGTNTDSDESGIDMTDVLDSFDDAQTQLLHELVEEALPADEDGNSEEVSHSTEEDAHIEHEDAHIEHKEVSTKGGSNMSQNVFDNQDEEESGELQLDTIIHSVMSGGSVQTTKLKHDIIKHAETIGISNIEELFPDARAMSKEPHLVSEDRTWVGVVSRGVHRTPFSRVKSFHAVLSEESARARGFMKGGEKFNNLYQVFNRTTSPGTVYTRNELNRDDYLDLTTFDAMVWLKKIMRLMQDEELARAILIGDDRAVDHADHISSESIRPILYDHEKYTTRLMTRSHVNDAPLDVVDDIAAGHDEYKGKGSPVLFINQKALTKMQLVRDSMGRRIHGTRADLAGALLVDKIIPVSHFDGHMVDVVDTAGPITGELVGILVNMTDYNVGTDRRGKKTFFDDFNLTYNIHEFLLESRHSGALIDPYTAVAFIQPDQEPVV